MTAVLLAHGSDPVAMVLDHTRSSTLHLAVIHSWDLTLRVLLERVVCKRHAVFRISSQGGGQVGGQGGGQGGSSQSTQGGQPDTHTTSNERVANERAANEVPVGNEAAAATSHQPPRPPRANRISRTFKNPRPRLPSVPNLVDIRDSQGRTALFLAASQ